MLSSPSLETGLVLLTSEGGAVSVISAGAISAGAVTTAAESAGVGGAEVAGFEAWG